MKRIIVGLSAVLFVGYPAQAAVQEKTVVNKPSAQDVLKDIIGTVKSVIGSVNTFKEMPSTATGLMNKMNCIANPGGSCKCADEKACISSFMIALSDFLNELNLSLFGKIQGAALTEPGPLLKLSGLIKTGYAYRGKTSDSIDKLVVNMTAMANRIQSSVEFLQLLGFMIDPMGTLNNQSSAQQKMIKEEPIQIQTEESGALDL